MRMWMVPPHLMCDKHLLGEHGELHKFLHNWRKKHAIDGRISGNAMEPLAYKARHDVLAEEMQSRWMVHKSPIEQPDFSYLPLFQLNYKVDIQANKILLVSRCPQCAERIKYHDES